MQKGMIMTTEMNRGEIVIFQSASGDITLDARLKNDTIWLTQKQIAELFGTKRPAITKHLKNIFASGELIEEMVCSKMELTTIHGAIIGKTQTIETNFYNLDAILSVGYLIIS